MTYNIPGVSPYTITGTQRNESGRIVIVADPDDDAIRIYRDLGFTETERQIQLYREPESQSAGTD